jgi:hypothetical protein
VFILGLNLQIESKLISNADTGTLRLNDSRMDGEISPIFPILLPFNSSSAERPGIYIDWSTAFAVQGIALY